ncbi:MAG: hypothetical protein EPN88_15290 [Bacteroidetes bacterium]|nr:MAG: hypothetical protein EPN88_15290 [Bacteroidota bacterium]
MDKNNALIYGEFDNNKLRLNANVGINANPTQWENLNIEQQGDAADIRVAGEGNPNNYSSLFLGAIGVPYKEWQINHRNTNSFNLTFYNGVTYNDMLVLNNAVSMELNGSIIPKQSSIYSLGNSGFRWLEVFAVNGLINTSDIRLKENISDLSYGLKEVLSLRPVSFYWKNNTDREKKIGLIAQEVQGVVNEAVKVGNDENQTLGLNYSELIPVLIKGIQEQQRQIESTAKENQQLKSELQSLKDEIVEIKTLLTKN